MEMRTTRRQALPGEANYHKQILACAYILVTTLVGCVGADLFPSRPSPSAAVSELQELALLTAFSEPGSTKVPAVAPVATWPSPSTAFSQQAAITPAVTPTPPQSMSPARTRSTDTRAASTPATSESPDQLSVLTGTIQRGQTALALLRNAGIEASQALAMWHAVQQVYDIRRLRVGQPYTILRTPDGQLYRFTYDIDANRRFHVQRQQQRFVGHIAPVPTQAETHDAKHQPQPVSPAPVSTNEEETIATAPPPARQLSQPTSVPVVITGTVKRGETATALFAQAGMNATQVMQVQRAIRTTYDIRLLRPGHAYTIQATPDGHLQHFAYDITPRRRLNVARHTTTFTSRITPIAPEQPHPVRATSPISMPSTTARQPPAAVPPPRPTAAVKQQPPAPVTTVTTVTTGKVKSGQTAVSIFSHVGVDSTQVMAMRRATRQTYDIRRLHAGHVYTIAVDADGHLQRFTYDITDQKRLEVTRQHRRFVSKLTSIPYERYERVINGRIDDSIYATLTAQGESPRLVRALADIFAWKIDFPTDLRQGDQFRLLIEERARKGQLPHYHRILAAELVNQNDILQAVYYTKEEEYYHPDGSSLRGMFLRSPLRYRRISSHFSRRRLHPILKRYRPHWGVDYAAPRGTPVRTVGDGVIKWVGHKGQNGKLITIRHTSVYTTHYLHLSRYARGIKNGARVKQGQIIGYVGSTGLATGPHLDFRLSQNGRYVNPLTHNSVAAPAVSKRHLAAFRHFAQQQLAKLKQTEASRSQRLASMQGQE